MAKIVDKEQKRKEIALSCKELFLKKGIANLTISEVAKTANIGKGTVYEYFENKEEIIFEIVNILMSEHNIKKEARLNSVTTTKEKVKIFFNFFYNEEDFDLRQLYKEFISISLINPNQKMIDFQTNYFKSYFNWLENILKDGIEKKEIKPIALELAKGLFVLGDGIFMASTTTTTVTDIKSEISNYIDCLFELIKVEK